MNRKQHQTPAKSETHEKLVLILFFQVLLCGMAFTGSLSLGTFTGAPWNEVSVQ
jgi:hypothetical protein